MQRAKWKIGLAVMITVGMVAGMAGLARTGQLQQQTGMAALSSASIDPKAQALLEASRMAYQMLSSYSDEMETHSLPDYAFAPFRARVRYQLPDRASVEVTNEAGTSRFVSDGASLWSQTPDIPGVVRQKQAETGRDAIITALGRERPLKTRGGVAEGGLGLWMGLLLGQLPAGLEPSVRNMPSPVRAVQVGSPETVDGVAVNTVIIRYKTEEEETTTRYCLGKSDHLVRRIVISATQNGREKTLYTEEHRHVKPNPKLASTVFRFQSPQGARVVADTK